MQGGIVKKHIPNLSAPRSESIQIRWKIVASESTPLKFNMEPKKHPTEKENHLLNLHVQVPC